MMTKKITQDSPKNECYQWEEKDYYDGVENEIEGKVTESKSLKELRVYY